MPRKIEESVVVITGASSGIGRATALAFARRNAAVVLAARRENLLREVEAECERLGGRALVVPTDVTEEAAVQALARRAVEHFGRLDVWVNNAAVTVLGRFDETPADVYRRVIETTLFGYIHGARAALPSSHAQGGGVLINNASMVAKLPQPYASAYVVAKHGVRGLALSLRQELSLEGAADIHVCTVMPATIDTPFFQHAGNYTGRATRAMPPVYPVEKVANTIVRLAEKPRRETFVGASGRMLNLQFGLAPNLTERLLARMVDRFHLYQDRPAAPTPGNVLEPMQEGSGVNGGWRTGDRSTARRVVAVGAAAVPAALALFTMRRRMTSSRR